MITIVAGLKVLRMLLYFTVMYNCLIKIFTCRPNALYKWGQDLEHLTDLDWQNIFEMPRLNTNEKNLHYLHFRFIRRIITTYKLLHALGKD